MVTKLLRAEEVAETLNVSKAFVYQMIRENRLHCVRMGAAVRVRPEDLDAFIRANLASDESDQPYQKLADVAK